MKSEQYEAEIASEQDAKSDVNKLIWICAGLFGNIIGILVAYIYQPTPPFSRLYEKSEEYKMYYTEAYKEKMRRGQITYALIGLLIIIGFNIILFTFIMVFMIFTYSRSSLF